MRDIQYSDIETEKRIIVLSEKKSTNKYYYCALVMNNVSVGIQRFVSFRITMFHQLQQQQKRVKRHSNVMVKF